MRTLLVLIVAVLLQQASPVAAQYRGGGGYRPGPYPPYPYPYYPYPVFFPFPQFDPSAIRYAPTPPPTDVLPSPKSDKAAINIILPSTANDIWVDGVKMATRETSSRVFVSPPLEPGHSYTYTIRAAWPQGLSMVTQTRNVVVTANQTATVDFTQPPAR